MKVFRTEIKVVGIQLRDGLNGVCINIILYLERTVPSGETRRWLSGRFGLAMSVRTDFPVSRNTEREVTRLAMNLQC